MTSRCCRAPSTPAQPGGAPDLPWWQDPQYIIGDLTARTRVIRIINTLTHHEANLVVCREETLNEIQDRYLPRFEAAVQSV